MQQLNNAKVKTKQLQLLFSIALILILISSKTVLAQTGRITGKVIEKSTGEPLTGVSVGIQGTTKGAMSDINGVYIINGLHPGKHTVVFRYIGFQTLERKDIIVSADKSTPVNAALEIDAEQTLNELVITAKVNRETESALLAERKDAVLVVQKIGSQELSRKGLSNVSEGVNKIAGISVAGNKNVFVRGLGDRYNTTTLNGLPIPSTNPDVKLIPLDIFPTGVVKNIAVSKSYSPELYGDFSGGAIDIVTKDYPEKGFFKVDIGSGYNSIVTGKQFYTTDNGTLNTLGFGRQERGLPASIANTHIYDPAKNTEPLQFNIPWSPAQQTAPVSRSLSLSGGNLYRFSKARELGFLIHANHKNGYRFNEGISAMYTAERPEYVYSTKRYSYTTNTSGLFNLYYKAGKNSSYSFTSLFVNDSANDIFDQRGEHNDLGAIYGRRNSFQQNTLFANQASANYSFLENRLKLKVAAEYAKTIGTTPDRVQNTLYEDGRFVVNSIADNHRFFADLDDNDYSGNIGLTYSPADTSKIFKQISFGVQGRTKKRSFVSRQFDTKIGFNPLVDKENIDATLNNDNLSAGLYSFEESYYAPNTYNADLSIGASYLNFNFNLSKKLNLITGLRAEYSIQNTYYKTGRQTLNSKFQLNELEDINLLPALTLKYGLTPKSNLLLAASRTISRPQFVEAAPFKYNEGAASFEREGNPFLTNSANYNADLKYEFYPSPSEIIAFTVFGKYIDNPIELAQKVSAEPLFTYINSDQAILGGVELEYNRNVGQLFGSSSKVLKNSSLGFNAAYMYSQIKIGDKTIEKLRERSPIAPTNRERPLFGSSPYLVNVDVSYKQEWSKVSNTIFTLTYNTFGKRLFIAGSEGAGDVYEMPVNTLDFIVNTKIKERIGLDLNIGNILNAKYQYKQEFKNTDLIFNEFRRGLNMGLSLNYTF